MSPPAAHPRKPSAREAILDAAAAIARRDGVLGLSVDRIVEAAGVSKGGFFYHFPTKEALVEAVVTMELDRFESLVESYQQTGNTYAQALAEAMVDFVVSESTMMASVNAALAFGGSIKELVLRRHDAWMASLHARAASGARATSLALAIDGLIFSCSLRTGSPGDAEVALLRRALRELAQ